MSFKKYFFLSSLLLGGFFFLLPHASQAAAPTGSSAVLQNSSSATVDLVITGTNFNTFVSSGTTTANSTDRAKFTWKSTAPTGAVINNATTITLTFSTSPVGTSVSGNLTVAADAVQDGSSVHNALITITTGSITDSAPPVVDAITNYIDLDHNGTVDYFTINFSEALATCTIEAGDWTIITPGQVNLTVPTGCSSYLGNWMKFNTVGATGVTGGATAPQLSYTNQGTLGSLKDAAGNEMANTGTLTFSDSAIAEIKSFTYQDGDGNGRIDRVLITFTESLHSLSVLRPTDLTFTNVGDFTGAAFGSGTTDVITGTTTTATIVFGTEASVVDTKEDSGNIAISSQNGFTLTDQALNGNIVLTPQTQASFMDGAAPVYVSSKTIDNNQNGTIDHVRVVYSEPISDASVAPSDYAAGFSGVGAGALVESFGSGTPGSGVFTDIANDEVIYVGVTSGTDVIAPNTTDYTLHIAQVGSVTDSVGNALASFSEKTSTDGAAPVLRTSTVISSPTNNTTPTISFSIIEGGTLSYSGGCTMPLTTVAAGAYDQAFNALTDGTYTCSIRGTDGVGNVSAPLTINTFTVDTAPPTLSATSATQNAGIATIIWTTNETTSSIVNYGPTTAYASATAETDTVPRVTTHSITISGLVTCSDYHFRPRSKDGAGNEVVGPDVSLTNIGACGGGLPAGALANPKVPDGGYIIIIKEGSAVSSPVVTLLFNAGDDIGQLALSNSADFTESVLESYQPTHAWNLCQRSATDVSTTSCKPGTYTVYAKFYTKWGRPSDPVMATATLQEGAFSSNALVQDGSTIYLILGGKKYGFTSFAAFQGLGYSTKRIVRGKTSSVLLGGLIKSASSAHLSGSWVVQNKTVYFVTDAGRIPVASWEVFLGNGGTAPVIVPANSADIAKPVLSVMTVHDARVR